MKSLTQLTGKVFLTRSFGMILALGLNLALTRWLGIAAYGGFAYIVSWVTILTIPSMGMETLLVREIATTRHKENDAHLCTLLRWSLKNTLIISCALSLTAILVYLFIASRPTGST